MDWHIHIFKVLFLHIREIVLCKFEIMPVSNIIWCTSYRQIWRPELDAIAMGSSYLHTGVKFLLNEQGVMNAEVFALALAEMAVWVW